MLDFQTIVSKGKEQIAADIKAGIVPSDVASFGDLHDYVDANYYGGAFEPETAFNSDNYLMTDAERQNPDGMTEAAMQFWNSVQNALNDWLAKGRP